MTSQQTTSLLVGLAVIVLIARIFGGLARRLKQPAVIGEVIAGIVLGPTLFHGAISDTLFPITTRPLLNALSVVGVVVFMFIVGFEWDVALVRGSGTIVPAVAISSIVLPFGLGIVLSLHLMHEHGTGNKMAFMLFMGIAMSITAFPVLARILTDRGMTRTPLGVVALACASIDDLLAWSLLAAVIAISGLADSDQWRTLLAIPYLITMLFVLRPRLRWLMERRSLLPLTPTAFAYIVVGLLLSSASTEFLGLHYIFGAFLFGAVFPRSGAARLRSDVHNRLGQISDTLLLPVFFTLAGLNVDLSGLDANSLGDLGLILLTAVGGKFVGAFISARLSRMPLRQSAGLATLMNTRGLTELIVLNVGLQLGLLSQGLYSLMVVMAVVTTAMTGPLLNWILGHPTGSDIADPTPNDAGECERAADVA